MVLEDDPLFNAGRGAVYNEAGEHELDASIMDGATLRAGAVAAVRRIRNPVLAARAVMEKSPHVLLAGQGAEAFARKHGIALVRQAYFHTAERLKALKKGTKRHHGTVGAVALDRHGNLAAATSTGGYTGKLPRPRRRLAGDRRGNLRRQRELRGVGNRMGRSLHPRCGSRTRCRRACCYLKESVSEAARAALRKLARIGGDGGLIALDRRGNIAMPFNSEGMLRACIHADGRREVGIYRRVVSNGLRV